MHRNADDIEALRDVPGAHTGRGAGWRWRAGALIVVAGACVLAAVLLPPIAQPDDYHRFADARMLLGVANFWNVATNLPILAAGIAGLAWLLGDDVRRERMRTHAAFVPYVVLFCGLALTAFGSTWYHLAPDSARLVWDRLPMTIAFTSLLSALIAERVDPAVGKRLLVPLLIAGCASVGWWQWTMARGAGDIGPYLMVQAGAVALVLLIVALFPARGRAIVAAGVLYVLAKIVEAGDERIFMAGGLLSGHSVKHLLVGLVGFQLLRAAQVALDGGQAVRGMSVAHERKVQ
jgi:hypothetical protein